MLSIPHHVFIGSWCASMHKFVWQTKVVTHCFDSWTDSFDVHCQNQHWFWQVLIPISHCSCTFSAMKSKSSRVLSLWRSHPEHQQCKLTNFASTHYSLCKALASVSNVASTQKQAFIDQFWRLWITVVWRHSVMFQETARYFRVCLSIKHHDVLSCLFVRIEDLFVSSRRSLK